MTGPDDENGRRADGNCDAGSMMPLVLGLALVLLLLVAGVSAVGSAFLARQDIQHACDGAAAVAGDVVASSGGGSATRAAQEYLQRPQRRAMAVTVVLTMEGSTPMLTCTGRADVSFAGVFDLQDVAFEVEAAGHPSVNSG